MYRYVTAVIICLFTWISAGYAEQNYSQPQQIVSQQQSLQGQVQTTAVTENVDKGQAQAPVNSIPLALQIPNAASPSKPPISANVEGGQDEYNVNWSAWRHRIGNEVWNYVCTHSIIFWGMTRVGYNVTRDNHIQITSIFSPDPTGKSAKNLVKAIMRLEGNSILEFPAGSKQLIHHSWNMAIGLPVPIFTWRLRRLYLSGGTEHVTEQW